MSVRIKIILSGMGLLLFLSSVPINAQLLQDEAVLDLVKQNIDYIYNMQFDEANAVYTKISQSYPRHPIVFLLRGMLTYWENYPLLHTSPSHVSFEEDMRECIELSESNESHRYEAEYLLADLCARGMLLSFYADNDLIMEVTPLTISTYKYLRRAFNFTSECTDLNYFTGVYDYYREAYPKIYPVYKSLAFLFPHGDMVHGIKEIQIASKRSVVMQAESYSMLSWIYLNFENKYSESLTYSKSLYEKYRGNTLYLAEYIKNLLLMKRYDQAEEQFANESEPIVNKYYQAQLTILRGILQEKKYHNNTLAQEYYNKGISDISLYGKYGNEYAAFAYFGLSRISDDNGEKHTRKIYRKEAMKLADFKKINFDK